MSHGGKRKAAGRKPTGRTGKGILFNCHKDNIEKAQKLADKNILSRVINDFLSNYPI